jgi:hypothetical protein
MFDLTIGATDCSYVFEIIKKQKLDIVNENIPIILNKLKEETDHIVSKIFKVFKLVLDRAPDVNEIDQYVEFFRIIESSPEEKLEKILMRTLEFHDNVKKKIKTEFMNKNTKEVLPSILFDILNRVVVKLDECDMKSIDALITSFC